MSDVRRQTAARVHLTPLGLYDIEWFFLNFYVILYGNSSQWHLFRHFAVTTIWRTGRQSSSVRAVKFLAFVWEVPDPNFCRNTGYPVWKRMVVLSPSGKYWGITLNSSSAASFYILVVITSLVIIRGCVVWVTDSVLNKLWIINRRCALGLLLTTRALAKIILLRW